MVAVIILNSPPKTVELATILAQSAKFAIKDTVLALVPIPHVKAIA